MITLVLLSVTLTDHVSCCIAAECYIPEMIMALVVLLLIDTECYIPEMI